MRIMLDCALSAKEIKTATNAETSLSEELEFKFICTNSKEVMKGDLFVAIRGESLDGNDYAIEAQAHGAYPISEKNLPNSFFVPNSRTALLALAALYKTKLRRLICTVAITGSVGKSTTKEFTKALLEKKYRVQATDGNENNHIGVPLTVFRASKETEVLIIEAGMNHAGEIKEISDAISPDIAIITNIGTAHIGNLGSREMIARAKLEIRSGMHGGRIILPYGESYLSGIENGVYVSVGCACADSHFENIEIKKNESLFDYRSASRKIEGLKLRVSGEHYLKCLLFAITTAELLRLKDEDIKTGVSLISEDILRQKYVNAANITIYDDSYNSSYDSVKAVLDMLDMKGEPYSVLLADMLELGDFSEELHRDIGKLAACSRARVLYLLGDFAELIKEGAISCGFDERNIFTNHDLSNPTPTALQILENAKDGETLLFKGSHSTRLHRVVDILKKLTEARDVR